jgi:hypothetical protein
VGGFFFSVFFYEYIYSVLKGVHALRSLIVCNSDKSNQLLNTLQVELQKRQNKNKNKNECQELGVCSFIKLT